jgi:hypothetical protein
MGIEQFPDRRGDDPNIDLFLGQFLAGRTDQTNSDPVPIRMMSGLSLGASIKTHAPRRKPSGAAN